ncbi:hypothetical protein, partial [Galbibacter pacificus]
VGSRVRDCSGHPAAKARSSSGKPGPNAMEGTPRFLLTCKHIIYSVVCVKTYAYLCRLKNIIYND